MPTVTPRTVNSLENPLARWKTSVHSISSEMVNPIAGLGGYTSVGESRALPATPCTMPEAPRTCCTILLPRFQTLGRLARVVSLATAPATACCRRSATCSSNTTPEKGTSFCQYHELAYGERACRTESESPHHVRRLSRRACHTAGHDFRSAAGCADPRRRERVGISAADGDTVLKPAINQYEIVCAATARARAKGRAPRTLGRCRVARSRRRGPAEYIAQLRDDGEFDASGDARPVQRFSAAQPVANHVESGRRDPGTSHGRAHLLHRLSQ